IDLRARATGALDKVHVKEGDSVKRGALLFEIDSRAARLDLEQARANQNAAEAQLKLAIATCERVQRLVDSNVASREELLEREAAVAVAKANVDVARAKVAQALLLIDYTRITAPIAGRIGLVNVSEGQIITADEKSPVLAKLVANDPL